MSKEWAAELAGHPDQEFRDYILKGISHGFHIGFDYGRYPCRPATSNMGSASKNAEVVQAYLLSAVKAGSTSFSSSKSVHVFYLVFTICILKNSCKQCAIIVLFTVGRVITMETECLWLLFGVCRTQILPLLDPGV